MYLNICIHYSNGNSKYFDIDVVASILGIKKEVSEYKNKIPSDDFNTFINYFLDCTSKSGASLNVTGEDGKIIIFSFNNIDTVELINYSSVCNYYTETNLE